MPRFYNDDEEETSKAETPSADNKGEIKYWKTFMVLVFFYYFISCGVERIYQVFTIYLKSQIKNVLFSSRWRSHLVCADLWRSPPVTPW